MPAMTSLSYLFLDVSMLNASGLKKIVKNVKDLTLN